MDKQLSEDEKAKFRELTEGKTIRTVDKNFQDWVFKKHSGAGEKFTENR